MKKALLVVTVSFVVITVAVFVVYPYGQRPSPVNPEGVYVRYSEHQFGKEWDTLWITKQAGTPDRYRVMRRWKYERRLDGKTIPPEYKRSESSLQFLRQEGLFLEEETGLRYSCDDRKKELLAGATLYKKTN